MNETISHDDRRFFSYGLDHGDMEGFDCLVIPSASQPTTTGTAGMKALTFSEFCGSSKTFTDFDDVDSKTVCCK